METILIIYEWDRIHFGNNERDVWTGIFDNDSRLFDYNSKNELKRLANEKGYSWKIMRTHKDGTRTVIEDSQFEQRVSQILGDEYEKNEESIWWLSFCDTGKPKGMQFQGVIIIKALGMADALRRTWLININPGGEVKGFQCTENLQMINYEKMGEKLLSKEQLKEFGLI